MKKLFLTLMLVAALFIAPVAAIADSSITFIWNPNIEADLLEYRIFDSPTSGDQNLDPNFAVDTIPAGTETSTIQASDGSHHWVLVAYDNSGNPSGKTAEATAVLDSIGPAIPTGFQITVIIKFEPQ